MEALSFSGSQFVLVDSSLLAQLVLKIEELNTRVSSINHTSISKTLYTNSEVKELLGIGDKLLKKYRDDGKLGFTQVGDKFWYTLDDLEKFLYHENHYFPPFHLQRA